MNSFIKQLDNVEGPKEEFEYIIHKHSKECRLQFVDCKRIVLNENQFEALYIIIKGMVEIGEEQEKEQLMKCRQLVTELIKLI